MNSRRGSFAGCAIHLQAVRTHAQIGIRIVGAGFPLSNVYHTMGGINRHLVFFQTVKAAIHFIYSFVIVCVFDMYTGCPVTHCENGYHEHPVRLCNQWGRYPGGPVRCESVHMRDQKNT